MSYNRDNIVELGSRVFNEANISTPQVGSYRARVAGSLDPVSTVFQSFTFGPRTN